MLTLGIETSGRAGSVALLEDDVVLSTRSWHPPRGHGAPLLAQIDTLFHDVGRVAADVDLFVACAGPGSFTGVRVGLTTAKALAWALGRPVTAVDSLSALAHNAVGHFPGGTLVGPVLDARKREIYGAVFRLGAREGLPLELVVPACVMPAAEFVRTATAQCDEPVNWLGSGVGAYAEVFGTSALDPAVGAATIARLGRQRFQQVGEDGLDAPVARYVRPSEAEVKFGAAPKHDPLAGVDGL